MVIHDQYEAAVKSIIQRIGKNIVIGVPLGIGKPIGLLNALYQAAAADVTLQLTIITGLTLARPLLKNALEKRLIQPILDRLLADYEDPLYEKARMLQQLPANISVLEFFFTPGKYLHLASVQQNYISSAYTHVVRDSMYYGINVYAQQVSPSPEGNDEYSLSSNSDLFPDIFRRFKAEEAQGKPLALVAELNAELPYMLGDDAIVKSSHFTDVINTQRSRRLFAMPREAVSSQDHMIGLYTSALIKDDGCLQIGIGSLSNAVASALIMRHNHNSDYIHVLDQFAVRQKFGDVLAQVGEVSPFVKGLYASTEMLSDEYLHLFKEGVLKKKVYDHGRLQALLNQNTMTEKITPDTIDILLANHVIEPYLTGADFNFLHKFGILNPQVRRQDDHLILPDGEKIPADLTKAYAKQALIKKGLGQQLIGGKMIHAGFFLGSHDFYQQLRELPPAVAHQIDMTSITRTNEVFWSLELSGAQRQCARFVNTAMMVTLGGTVVSDGIEGWQEVSGVGGQFDFVYMAQHLPNARSIINCRSTRPSRRGTVSNIVWEHPNVTIPRYLRDIVVTEYGIADCRSKTDADVMKALLNIVDSRFQSPLLQQAKAAGKLPKDYQIPAVFRQNTPQMIRAGLSSSQAQGYCQPYPFGSDLTGVEQVLAQALQQLKNYTLSQRCCALLKSLFFFKRDTVYEAYLKRMDCWAPKNLQEYVYKKLLKYMLYRIKS